MIYIREEECKKLPGVTSLFLTFEYNQDVIDALQNYQYRVWDKKAKVWELPVTDLSQLVKDLQYCDDIQINLKEDGKVTRREAANDYKLKPYSYQIEGITFGLNHDKWLLLDEMGLGKTLQTTYIAEELYKSGDIEHCLIICGINSLKTNWEKEIKKSSDLSCRVVGKRVNRNGNTVYMNIPERAKQIANGIEEFFLIINIESLRSDDIIKALQKQKIGMIVVDEIQKAKSKTSQQGKNLLKLRADYMIAATGTLIMNNPLDAYMPLTWIGKNNCSLSNFKSYYCRFGGFHDSQIIGYKHMDMLKYQIENCSLRRTKDLLNLPPKTVIHEVLDMNDTQLKFYHDLLDNVADDIVKEGVNLNLSYLLTQQLRLRQASTCPSILTDLPIRSTKIDRAIDLAEEIIANGDKVIIFSMFKEPINILYNELAQYNPVLGTGDILDEVFSNNVDQFQQNPNCKVFLGTIQKAGTGITLTAASYVIFIDCDWVPANNIQAEDRAYRIGTTKPVFIYYLWNDDTVDMRMKYRVEDKSQVAGYIVDDKIPEKALDTMLDILGVKQLIESKK